MLLYLLILAVAAGSGIMATSGDNSDDELADITTLRVVDVLYRHGDRAPVQKLPMDRYNESYWTYGYGELTDKGKRQHYKLGRYFRARYRDFIGYRFNKDEIYIRSSDYDRCLISAYSNLAGIFSNDTESADLHLPFMTWQPMPVHTVPLSMDKVLAMDKPCNEVKKEQERLFSSPLVSKINENCKNFYKFITNNTSVDLSQNGLRDIWVVHDTLYCEMEHDFSLPTWTNQIADKLCRDTPDIKCENKTVWDVLVAMANLQFTIMYNSTVMHRFDGGPLLEQVVSDFQHFVKRNRTAKFNVYSAHDSTVAAVLSALGVYDKQAPQYTATVMIELHKATAENSDFNVKVFYKKYTDKNETTELHLPGCPGPCKLETFSNLVEKLKVRDWDAECHNAESKPKPVSGLREEEIIIITVLSAVVVILSLSAFICYIRRKRISSSSYYRFTDQAS